MMMILSRTRSSPLPPLVRNLIMKVIYMVMMLTVIVTGDTDTTYSPTGTPTSDLEVEISFCKPETYHTCLYQAVPGLFTTEVVGMMIQQPNAQNIKSFLSKGIDVIDECWDCLSGSSTSLVLFCQGFSYVDRYLNSQLSNIFPDLVVLCNSVSVLGSTTTDTDDESATINDHGKTEIAKSSAGREDSHPDEVSMASSSSGEIETVITTFDAESSTFEEDLFPDELYITSVNSSKARNYNRKLGKKTRKKFKDRILLIGIEYCQLDKLQNLLDKYKTDTKCSKNYFSWRFGRCDGGCKFWTHPNGLPNTEQGCYRTENGIHGPYCERPDGTVYSPSKVVTGRIDTSPPRTVYDYVCASKCPPSALNLTYKCDQVQRLFGCTTNSNVCQKKMWDDLKIWTDFLANMYPGKKAISSLNKAAQAGNDVRRVQKLLRISARAAKRNFKRKFKKQLKEARKEFKEMMKDLEDIAEEVADAFFESILDEVMMEQTLDQMGASVRGRAKEALITIVGIFSPLDFEAIKELYWKQPKCKELTDIFKETKLGEIEWLIVDKNKENVAFGKPTRQSSTQGNIFSSKNAVDGDRDGTHTSEEVDASPITLTRIGTQAQDNPWWEVDLLGSFDIRQINIYNREDSNQDRLRGFRVEIFDRTNRVVESYDHPQRTPGYETIIDIKKEKLMGNKVRVSIPGSKKILSLAEVEVIAKV